MRRMSLIPKGLLPGMLMAGVLAVPAAAQAQRVEGSFQRTLTSGATPEIEVETGSGSITVRAGGGGRVEISGRIQADDRWNRGSLGAEERVRRIEAEPPVQQEGNVIRIGRLADEELRRGVSISYTLTVPAGSSLRSNTGSGSQQIEGLTGAVQAQAGSGSLTFARLGGSLRASTGSGGIAADGVASLHATAGSGSIRATGVSGPIVAKTGSGGIEVTQAGSGDVEVSSGSGRVTLRGVKGALKASTASGGLTVQGELAGDWRLSAASGGIDVSLPAGQGFQLDADTSSGRIDMGMPVTVVGTIGRRALRGSVHGGGPLLHVRTASGGIRIGAGRQG